MVGEAIRMSRSLRDRFVATLVERHPTKSFGYLVSRGDPDRAVDFVVFEDNVRNHGSWRPDFERRGRYFVDHDDAGFVASPEDALRAHRLLEERGLVEIGVFHSHRRHPANFSGIDHEMHTAGFDGLWHVVVSLRNVDRPEVRAFAVAPTHVREVEIRVDPADDVDPLYAGAPRGAEKDEAIRHARFTLTLDRAGRPECHDNRALFDAVRRLLVTADEDAIDALLRRGFLAAAEERRIEHMEPMLATIAARELVMGTEVPSAGHFVGETPAHRVTLSSFSMSRLAVTNRQYALLDPARGAGPATDRAKPVVNVTWFDAAVFALWVGCRLPTEAEWELACGNGAATEWCCIEEDLMQYAWFSDNAVDTVQPVGLLCANPLGIYDLHGNVWEWCQDDYAADYYGRSPPIDPVNTVAGYGRASNGSGHKVTRGGSVHALSEMCRTRYRFHEAPGSCFADLGFRVACDRQP